MEYATEAATTSRSDGPTCASIAGVTFVSIFVFVSILDCSVLICWLAQLGALWSVNLHALLLRRPRHPTAALSAAISAGESARLSFAQDAARWKDSYLRWRLPFGSLG